MQCDKHQGSSSTDIALFNPAYITSLNLLPRFSSQILFLVLLEWLIRNLLTFIALTYFAKKKFSKIQTSLQNTGIGSLTKISPPSLKLVDLITSSKLNYYYSIHLNMKTKRYLETEYCRLYLEYRWGSVESLYISRNHIRVVCVVCLLSIYKQSI